MIWFTVFTDLLLQHWQQWSVPYLWKHFLYAENELSVQNLYLLSAAIDICVLLPVTYGTEHCIQEKSNPL